MTHTPAGTVAHPPIEVRWVRGATFEAGRPQGPRIAIDGDAQTAPSPFDALLAAIASCASVDVVTILEKQRTPVRALEVRIEANRVASIPPSSRLGQSAFQHLRAGNHDRESHAGGRALGHQVL